MILGELSRPWQPDRPCQLQLWSRRFTILTMQETTPPRTLGHGYGGTTAGMITALGFIVAIVGSVGPWVAHVVGSSGFQLQGKVTAAIAVAGIVLLFWGRGAVKIMMLVAMVELALGGYEYVHLHSIFGQAVGWGVYAVIAGAVLAAGGTAFSFAESGI